MENFTFLKRSAFTPFTGDSTIDANNKRLEKTNDQSLSEPLLTPEQKNMASGILGGSAVGGGTFLAANKVKNVLNSLGEAAIDKKVKAPGKAGKALKTLGLLASTLAGGTAGGYMASTPTTQTQDKADSKTMLDKIFESPIQNANDNINKPFNWKLFGHTGGGLLAGLLLSSIIGNVSGSKNILLPLTLALLGSGLGYTYYKNKRNEPLNIPGLNNLKNFNPFKETAKTASEENKKQKNKSLLKDLIRKSLFAAGGAGVGAISTYGLDKLIGNDTSDLYNNIAKAVMLGGPIGALGGLHLESALSKNK